MNTKIIKKWEENNRHLREYIATNPQSMYGNYEEMVKLLVKYILNTNEEWFNSEEITVVDDGDYQGALIFLIPAKTYQPSKNEYLVTSVEYGSCSGCDTLKSIRRYTDGFPTEEQIDDYMMLFLHLIQNMKPLYGG